MCLPGCAGPGAVPAELTQAIEEPNPPDPAVADTAELARYVLDLVAWGRLGWSRLATVAAVYGEEG